MKFKRITRKSFENQWKQRSKNKRKKTKKTKQTKIEIQLFDRWGGGGSTKQLNFNFGFFGFFGFFSFFGFFGFLKGDCDL